MSVGTQLRVLLRKNCLLKKKSCCGVCCDIVFPLVIVALLLVMMSIFIIIKKDYDTNQLPSIGLVLRNNSIVYGPSGSMNAQQQQIIQLVFDQIKMVNPAASTNQLIPMATLEQMDAYYANNSETVKMGLWFPSNATASPNQPFQYAIRIDADTMPSTDVNKAQFSDSSAYARGFMPLQAAVDQAILSSLGSFASVLEVEYQLFPDPFTEMWQKWRTPRDIIYKNAGGLFITAALFFFGYRLAVDLVVEKESRVRQGMKMVGMSDFAYYLSWQIQTIYIGIPITFVVLIVLYLSGVIKHANFGIMLLLFLLYFISLLQLASILSLFFDKSKFAGIISYALVIGMSVGGIFVGKEHFSKNIKLLISLVSPIGFNCAIVNVALKDYNGESQDSSIYPSEFEITGMMAVDIILYILLLAYLDKVIPGEFGTTEPWYFPLSPNFWCPKKHSYESIINDHEPNEDVELSPMDSSHVTVSIKNLRKEFHTGNGLRTAVDGLYLDMHSDQIHAFLGHNGAGKSTTISILTGLISATGGDAFIDGHSIMSQMKQVRQVIGVCPQYDVIWKELTVLEHLMIYAALKGVPARDINAEAEKMAIEVGLPEKMNAPAGTLSGGQKRKLCLGIAFIGRSKIIFLDEVTSGMDPLSRRGVWDFLLKYKKGRTIILTTHFMDEADFLGDRIAIISHGRLRCDGSSLFLKKKFGIGYLLTMAKVPNVCNTTQVTQFIKQHIPEAVVLSDAGTELSFRLPTASVNQFVPFFRELDHQKTLLGISGYGISVTTMEEVFLRIGQESSANAKSFDINANENYDESVFKKAISTNSEERKPLQQFKGLLIKRIRTSYKDLKGFFLSLLLPAAIIAASIIVYKNVNTNNDNHNPLTPLLFNVSTYGPENYIPIKTPDNYIETLDLSPYYSSMKIVPNDLEDFLEKNYTNDGGALNFTTSLDRNFQLNSTDPLKYTVLYNIDYTHALPIHFNLFSDALMRNLSNGIGIQTINQPFKHVLTVIQKQAQEIKTDAILYFLLLFMTGYALMAGSFAGNVCAERNFNIKRLLYISGCKKYVYWLSNLVWDYVFAFILLIIVSSIVVSIIPEFKGKFGIVFLGQLLYCISIIPLAYLMSYMFKTHGKATGAIFGIHLALSTIFLLVSLNLRITAISDQKNNIQKASDIADYCFFIISPLYCLAKIMVILAKFPGFVRLGEMSIDNNWDWYACGAPILFLALHCVVWLTWLFVLDLIPELRGRLKNPRKNSSPQPDHDEDSDVAAERIRVRSNDNNGQEVVSIQGLHRVFRSKGKNPKKIAVHNTTLGIPRGQTFGLLGMNGAGKTTTLSMLSGDIMPSAGSAMINGYDLITDRSNALHSIGSCPQFDALIPLLSAREQLWLYARIKGIPENQIHETVEAFLTMMDLQGLANSNTGGYSGGNKRKLSLSIAMLGNPSVVFLDEPSTGCDPQVRRFMWNVISELGTNKVIIITTHSMEECEALCQRISIMKDGKFTCLGSNQHIKSKFGSGYSVDIKFKKEYLDSGINTVLKAFPSSFLLDQHDLIANFELPNNPHNPIMISEIFSILQNQLSYLMDDYSLSQMSLEQVFIKLTSTKHSDRLDVYSERHHDVQPAPMF